MKMVDISDLRNSFIKIELFSVLGNTFFIFNIRILELKKIEALAVKPV